MFTSVVVGNRDISQVEKIQYLLTKLRGEAFQIVKRFDLVGQNFELTWEALQSRYENPRILVNQQIKHITSIQTAQKESSKYMRLIVDTINEKIAILKTCNINTSSWDPMLTYICRKMPYGLGKTRNNHEQFSERKDGDAANRFRYEEAKLKRKFRFKVKHISLPSRCKKGDI